MLNALWPLLKSGGILLYATCSVLKEENEKQIEIFLASKKDAEEKVIQADWGQACQHGRQILPGEHNMDGFYYCVLVKKEY